VRLLIYFVQCTVQFEAAIGLCTVHGAEGGYYWCFYSSPCRMELFLVCVQCSMQNETVFGVCTMQSRLLLVFVLCTMQKIYFRTVHSTPNIGVWPWLSHTSPFVVTFEEDCSPNGMISTRGCSHNLIFTWCWARYRTKLVEKFISK